MLGPGCVTREAARADWGGGFATAPVWKRDITWRPAQFSTMAAGSGSGIISTTDNAAAQCSVTVSGTAVQGPCPDISGGGGDLPDGGGGDFAAYYDPAESGADVHARARVAGVSAGYESVAGAQAQGAGSLRGWSGPSCEDSMYSLLRKSI